MKKIGPFPGDVKPVRKGIYQRDRLKAVRHWSYWDGSSWGVGVFSRVNAWKYRDWRSKHQSLPWYGIEKPR